jgi:hypothetical protein
MAEVCGPFGPPAHQGDATLSVDNPISGTKYTVLATTRNVRIITICVKVIWTVQPTPLEAHITANGVNITLSFTNPVTATWYFDILFNPNNDDGALSAANPTSTRPFLLESQSVKIEVETTGGTVSNLSARVKWARW